MRGLQLYMVSSCTACLLSCDLGSHSSHTFYQRYQWEFSRILGRTDLTCLPSQPKKCGFNFPHMSLLRAKAEIPKDYFLNKRRFITFHWKGICYRWNCVCVGWKDEGPGCGLEDYRTAPSSSFTSHSFSVVIDIAFDLQSSSWKGKQEVRALMA